MRWHRHAVERPIIKFVCFFAWTLSEEKKYVRADTILFNPALLHKKNMICDGHRPPKNNKTWVEQAVFISLPKLFEGILWKSFAKMPQLRKNAKRFKFPKKKKPHDT